MPDEMPHILDLDVLRARAAKFKELQAGLEARGKELEQVETRLVAEHISMGGRALALESAGTALQRSREKLARTRSTLQQDAATVQSERLAVADQQRRLLEMVPVLEDRDRFLREAEERLKRRSDRLADQVQKSEARLRILAERENALAQRERELEEMITRVTVLGEAISHHEKKLSEREEIFTRRHNEWLAVLDIREKQVAAFSDAMAVIAAEDEQRIESYSALRAALEEEIDRVAVARESAVAQGDWLREAQEILTSTVEAGAADSEGVPWTASPSPSPEPASADPPESLPPLEIQAASAAIESEERAEPEVRRTASKDGAVGRLVQAIEAWERARAAGLNVSTLRGHAKSAREALASGDYEEAMRSATTILTRLQATPALR